MVGRDLLPDGLGRPSEFSRAFCGLVQLLLTVAGDEIIDVYTDAIRAHLPNGTAIASADRPKRLADIARQRAELERREEELVMHLERQHGVAVARRDTADPSVVACTVLVIDAAA